MQDQTQNQPMNDSAQGTVPNPSETGFPSDIPVASPSDFFPPAAPTSFSGNFARKQIINTVLGLFLLVGGLAAGTVLVMQPQLFEQRAQTILPSLPTPTPVPTQAPECSIFTDYNSCGSNGCKWSGVTCTSMLP